MKNAIVSACLLVACSTGAVGQSSPAPAHTTSLKFTEKGCPPNAQSMPVDRTPIAATDYIEFRVVTSFLPPGPYRVRIYANGRAVRAVATCQVPEAAISVSPDETQKILARAREGGFPQLCAVYTFVPRAGLSVDGSETSLTLSLHGQVKTVLNSLGNPPPIYEELANAIEKIAPSAQYAAACDGRKAK